MRDISITLYIFQTVFMEHTVRCAVHSRVPHFLNTSSNSADNFYGWLLTDVPVPKHNAKK
jgi:hypothetical protein